MLIITKFIESFNFNCRFGVAIFVLVFFTYNVFKDGQGKALVQRKFHLMIQEQMIVSSGIGVYNEKLNDSPCL